MQFRNTLPILTAIALFGVGCGSTPDDRMAPHAASTEGVTSATWQFVPSIDIGTGTFGNKFNGAAAITTNDAWAVGYSPEPGGPLYAKETLAEHWDGSSWSVVATPGLGKTQQELDAVAALGASDVWAVGFGQDLTCGLCQRTLVEHWDGSSWSIVPSPSPGVSSSLAAVAPIATNDVWAVGTKWVNLQSGGTVETGVAMHWNGSTWSAVALPPIRNAWLSGVAATSQSNVWAIGLGTNNTPLALHYDGTSWSTFPFPIEQGVIATVLKGITAIAANDIWVVGWVTVPYGTEGQVNYARTYHFDGSTWSQITNPLGWESTLTGVAKIASNDVWAVGDDDGITSTMHYDGSAWTLVSNPGGGTLFGVAAETTTDVWAVGQDYALGTFTLHYAP